MNEHPPEPDFLRGSEELIAIYSAVSGLIDDIGPSKARLAGEQVGFVRGALFATLRRLQEGHDGSAARLGLSVLLNRRDWSANWNQVEQLRRGWFLHYRELSSLEDVDDEIRHALSEAWRAAG